MFVLAPISLKRLRRPEPSVDWGLKRTPGAQLRAAHSSFRKNSGLSPWATPVEEGVTGITIFNPRRRIEDVLEKECCENKRGSSQD